MEQKTFDFLADTEHSDLKSRSEKRIAHKKRKQCQRGQLGFEFLQLKRKSWPFCEHCRVRRAATLRWMIGCGSSLKPAVFKGKPICQSCFGRSDDEEPVTIDSFAEKRTDSGYDTGGFSWIDNGDE